MDDLLYIHINSEDDRQPGQSRNNWTTYFTNPIELRENSEIAVEHITLPNVYPQFKTSNSVLWVEVDNSGYGIPISTTAIYTTVSDLITDLNATATAMGIPVEFSYTASGTTRKIVLENNGSSGEVVRPISPREFESSYSGATLLWNGSSFTNYNGLLFNQAQSKLGFTADYSSTTVANSNTLTAESVPFLLRSSCYYLASDLTSRNHYSATNSRDILVKVGATANWGSLIIQRFDNFLQWSKVNESYLYSASFRILDDQFEEVDYPCGQGITFTLVVKL